VDFRNVVFGYHPAQEPVLKGVSFGIQGEGGHACKSGANSGMQSGAQAKHGHACLGALIDNGT